MINSPSEKKLIKDILENTPNYGNIQFQDTTFLDKQKRYFLLRIIKWFHQNNGSINPKNPLYDSIHDIERILINNRYTKDDKELLNSLKDTIPWLQKDMKK